METRQGSLGGGEGGGDEERNRRGRTGKKKLLSEKEREIEFANLINFPCP